MKEYYQIYFITSCRFYEVVGWWGFVLFSIACVCVFQLFGMNSG